MRKRRESMTADEMVVGLFAAPGQRGALGVGEVALEEDVEVAGIAELGGEPAQFAAHIFILSVADGGLEQGQGRAQAPHRHARLVQRLHLAPADHQRLVEAILADAGVDDDLERLGDGHRRIDRDVGGLDDLLVRAAGEARAALGLGQHAEADRHQVGDLLGGEEQAGRVAGDELELELGEALRAPAGFDLALVEIELDQAPADLDLPDRAVHFRTHRRDQLAELTGGGKIGQRRVGERAKIGRDRRDPRFIFGAARPGPADFARRLDRLDEAVADLAHAQGEAALREQAVGAVVIDRELAPDSRLADRGGARWIAAASASPGSISSLSSISWPAVSGFSDESIGISATFMQKTAYNFGRWRSNSSSVTH